MSPPRITALEPSFFTGYWNNLFIGVWRGTVTVAGAQEWSRQFDNMFARHPKGFLALSIVEAGAPLPDAQARKALAAAMDRVAGIRAMAGVQEATGFAGAAVRCVLLALTNITSAPYPRGIFSGPGDAAQWLVPYLDTSPARVTAAQIVDAVEEFRSMCDPTRASSKSGARAFG